MNNLKTYEVTFWEYDKYSLNVEAPNIDHAIGQATAHLEYQTIDAFEIIDNARDEMSAVEIKNHHGSKESTS